VVVQLPQGQQLEGVFIANQKLEKVALYDCTHTDTEAGYIQVVSNSDSWVRDPQSENEFIALQIK
jgi:hypothetical protein